MGIEKLHEFDWNGGRVKICYNRKSKNITIELDAEGCKTLASILLDMAQEDIPVGEIIHLDACTPQWNGYLIDGSNDVVIIKS